MYNKRIWAVYAYIKSHSCRFPSCCYFRCVKFIFIYLFPCNTLSILLHIIMINVVELMLKIKQNKSLVILNNSHCLPSRHKWKWRLNVTIKNSLIISLMSPVKSLWIYYFCDSSNIPMPNIKRTTSFNYQSCLVYIVFDSFLMKCLIQIQNKSCLVIK